MVEQAKSKSFVRKEKLVLRNNIPEIKRALWSKEIFEYLQSNPLYQSSRTIFLYSSYQSEVDTTDLIRDALQKEKNVYCPKVHGDEMEFYQIYSFDDLLSGYKGIKEPSADLQTIYNKSIPSEDAILIILPLAAFNEKCQRIGYGKGYYDKYLSKLSGPFHTIGLAYDIQFEPEFTADEFDYPLDYIITEKKIYHNGGSNSWNI